MVLMHLFNDKKEV